MKFDALMLLDDTVILKARIGFDRLNVFKLWTFDKKIL
jgi:hypothetical protein